MIRGPGCRFFNDKCTRNLSGVIDKGCLFRDGNCYTTEDYVFHRDFVDQNTTTMKRQRDDDENQSGLMKHTKVDDTFGSRSKTVDNEISDYRKPSFLIKQQSPIKKPLVIDQNTNYISGPVEFFHFKLPVLKGVTKEPQIIYLFSDMHRSLDNICPIKNCNSLKNKSTDIGGSLYANTGQSENCYFISRLLRDIFLEAEQKNKMVDFYLEFPFQAKDMLSYNLTEEQIAKSGYLYQLYSVFDGCFTKHKRKCQFKRNVRFHYVDIRQIMLENNKDTLWGSFQKYLILERLPSNVTTFLEQITKPSSSSELEIQSIKSPIQSIEITNQLMNLLYAENGQNDLKLFKLYLTSYNFTSDVDNLFQNIDKDEDLISSIERLKFLTVNRGVNDDTNQSYVMHKIAAQFYGLSNESPEASDLANNILDFIIKRYISDQNYQSIFKMWNEFYNIYKSFIFKKQTGYSDFNKIKKDQFDKINSVHLMLPKIQQMGLVTIINNAYLLDAYLLARLFRSFEKSKKQHIASSTKIIYAGAAHIEIYKDFLKSINAELVFESSGAENEETSMRCVQSKFRNPADYLNNY